MIRLDLAFRELRAITAPLGVEPEKQTGFTWSKKRIANIGNNELMEYLISTVNFGDQLNYAIDWYKDTKGRLWAYRVGMPKERKWAAYYFPETEQDVMEGHKVHLAHETDDPEIKAAHYVQQEWM